MVSTAQQPPLSLCQDDASSPGLRVCFFFIKQMFFSAAAASGKAMRSGTKPSGEGKKGIQIKGKAMINCAMKGGRFHKVWINGSAKGRSGYIY